jgi:hypothetical protein
MLTQLTKEQWQELRNFVADPKNRNAFQKMDLPLQYREELSRAGNYELAAASDEKTIIEPSTVIGEGLIISQLVEARDNNELPPQATLFMDMIDASFSQAEIDAMIASGVSVEEIQKRLKEDILGKYGLIKDLTEEEEASIRAKKDSYIGEFEDGELEAGGIELFSLENDIEIDTLLGLPEQELSPEQGEWRDMLLSNFTEEELEILAGRGMTVNQLSYLLDEGMDIAELKEKMHDGAWLNKLTLLSLFAEMDNMHEINEDKTAAQMPEQDMNPELSMQEEAKSSVVDVNIGLGDYSATEVSSPEHTTPAADAIKPDATPELPASKADRTLSH